MIQIPEMFYLLDEEPGGSQDATCFLLDDNVALIKRPSIYPANDIAYSHESDEVVIDVVGVSGADTAAPWVLLLG